MTGRNRLIPVSVIVLTRNEAANIDACLSALAGFDEVFVVDSCSTDGTIEKALQWGGVVVPFVWNGKYPKKKQWSLEHLPLRNRWVFLVDADEVVTTELKTEIASAMSRETEGTGCAGYYVSGQPVIAGRPIRFGWWYSKLALLDRTRAAFVPCDDLDAPAMGEVEGHYQPVLQGRAGRLSAHVVHYDRKSFAAWIERHNRYADWESQVRRSGARTALISGEPRIRRWAKQAFVRLPCQPVLAFLFSYVARLGFLDGKAGLHHALSRAFYYWMIAVKEWEGRYSPSDVRSGSASARNKSTIRRRTSELATRL